MEVSAIFDIGKTNKKFFLLDKDFKEVHKEYTRFEEIPDDDGFPSENLPKLVDWVKSTFDKTASNPKFKITHVNFSTYGASLVHLDENQNVVAPFYNYLKPLPDDFEEGFFKEYGEKSTFELNTSSPYLGMLNSGLQLYYLKNYKPEIFEKIKCSVHFPQYLSSLFTGKLYSEYTSIGCHTGLWDFKENKYASWVSQEGLNPLLPPIVNCDVSYNLGGIKFGVGIHDSSSALVPYIKANNDPFVLISTGTWSICINPFNNTPLSERELKLDCLNFLGVDGKPSKASRLFLGEQFKVILEKLASHFNVPYESYKSLTFDHTQKDKRQKKEQLLFNHALLAPERFSFKNGSDDNFTMFASYEEAVHQLLNELTDLQIVSLKLAIGNTEVKKIFIDGGFSASEIFTKFLSIKLPNHQIYSSAFPLGSTLGAALVVNKKDLTENFLEYIYQVKLIEH